MKHQFSLLAIFLVGAFIWAQFQPAFAVGKEAEPAATLSSQLVEKDKRVDHLRKFLLSYDSPLASEAGHFITEADRLNLDWKLVPAIAGTESTFGKQVPYGSFNAWGWGIPTGAQWGLAFSNWKSAITAVSEGLRYNYVDKGAATIDQIGYIYAASPAWASHVRFFIDKIEAFTPTKPSLIDVTL